MANQPPGRPWFRLASLRSVAAPAQDPRPSLVQPTNRTNSLPPLAERGSVPSSPAQKLPVQSSSLPTSPLQNGSASSSVSSSSPTQKASPPKGGTNPSMKQVVQNVMQSPKPKTKPTTPPPSPLTLPPAQLKANSEVKPKIPEEAHPKSVIILEKRIENPKHWGIDNSGETLKNYNEKQYGNHRKSWGSEDSPMKVITIAGENRGAYMELIQSPKKYEFGDKPNYLYKNGVSKTKSENGESGTSSSGEGNVKKKENQNKRRAKSSHPLSAFMNSNVQCVNNSLLYNASCSHHDPGLSLSLTRKPFESGGFHVKEIVNGRHD